MDLWRKVLVVLLVLVWGIGLGPLPTSPDEDEHASREPAIEVIASRRVEAPAESSAPASDDHPWSNGEITVTPAGESIVASIASANRCWRPATSPLAGSPRGPPHVV